MGPYLKFFCIFILLSTFVFGEKNLIIKNGSFNRWKNDKPVGWDIKNCIKKKLKDGYALCFLEKGKCSQKLKGIKEKTKYRIEFFYTLPDYGIGSIIWKITGLKGKNLYGRCLTPYFHSKPIRFVDYFYVEKIEGEPEIIFYGGGKNNRTFLYKVNISPVEGGFSGVYWEKANEDKVNTVFSIFNDGNKRESYTYRAEIVNYFMEKIFEKEGKISLEPYEFFKFEFPFEINNSPRYRVKLEICDGKGLKKEDVSFITCNFIGKYRKSFRISEENWSFYLLKKDGSRQTEPEEISLPFQIRTPGESFHRSYAFLSEPDPEKNWYAIFEKEVFIPDFQKNERVFIDIPRAANSPEIYVNGKKAGEFEGRVPVFLDITDHVKPNSFNNIKIKVGTWKTGYKWEKDKITMILPYNGYHQGILSFNNYIHILPSIRITDVYIRPSYREKKIRIEYKIENNSQHPRVITVAPEILDNGKVIKKFKKGKALVRGESKTKIIFEEKWENPKLWMVRNPYLYRLRTKVFSDGKQIDEHNKRFGFREIWTEGKYVFLNGKKLKLKTRLSFPHPLHAGMPLNYDTQWRALRQYTENGIWFSRSFTIGDPFFLDLCDEMGYALRHSFELNAAFNDWRKKISENEKFWQIMEEHVRKLTFENRNHPSIIFWSMENETFLCGLADQQPWTVDKYRKLREIARGIHPGILIEHDGSEPENDCEILNHHYPLNPARTIPYSPIFPPEIFEKDRWYGLQLYPGSLLWDEKKPLVLGEDFIGFPEVPQSLSILNDEHVYNVWENNPRRGVNYEDFDKAYHRLHEPFMIKVRERELAYITTWPITDTGWSDVLKYIVVWIEEPFSHFKSGERIKLTGIIFYDLLDDTKAELIWEYKEKEGKILRKKRKTVNLKAGDVKKFEIEIKNPSVNKKTKTILSIKLIKNKKILAEREKVYTVYPYKKFPEISFILYDPIGETAEKFKEIGLKFEIKNKPKNGKLFVIGKNCLSDEKINEIKDEILKFVEEGGKVLILQQERRINQILPFEINPNIKTYSYAAYPRAIDHPVLSGIEKEELYFWREDGYCVSKNNYWKPEAGNYISILDGGTLGGFLTSPLLEIYTGNGSIMLCQLNLLENLRKEPMADRILSNLLLYSEKPLYRKTLKSVKVEGNKTFLEIFEKSGYLNIGENSNILIVDGKLKDIDKIKKIIKSAKSGKTVWIIGMNEESSKIWEKSVLKGLKLKKKEISHIIKKNYSPVIAGLSNTDLFWVGMKLAPLPGEWFSQGKANIIDYECELPEIEGAIELIEKGALIEIPYGKGKILVDNMNWWKYLNDDSLPKAKRIFTTIATNLGIKINPDIQLKPVDKSRIKFYPVDMSAILNEKLNEVLPDNLVFDGVPFLNKKGVLLLGSKNLTQPEPRLKSKVELNVGEKFDVICFLMTAYDPYEGGQGYGWGEMYGGIKFIYKDNTSENFSLLHKVHSLNIFEYMGDLLKAKLVWRGPTPFAEWWDMYTRWPGNRWIQREHPNNIYLTKWVNPYPEKKIEKIIFYSTDVHVVPVIIGITGGRYEK